MVYTYAQKIKHEYRQEVAAAGGLGCNPLKWIAKVLYWDALLPLDTVADVRDKGAMILLLFAGVVLSTSGVSRLSQQLSGGCDKGEEEQCKITLAFSGIQTFTGIVFFATYLLCRLKRHVYRPLIQMAGILFSLNFVVFTIFRSNAPSLLYGIFILVGITHMAKGKIYWAAQFLIAGVLMAIGLYEEFTEGNEKTYPPIHVSGATERSPLVAGFSDFLICFGCTVASVFLLHTRFSFDEAVESAEVVNAVTHVLVDQLKRYDTEAAKETLQISHDHLHSGFRNSMQHLVANLEMYRPCLPNYVLPEFQQSLQNAEQEEREEEEDEHHLRSDSVSLSPTSRTSLTSGARAGDSTSAMSALSGGGATINTASSRNPLAKLFRQTSADNLVHRTGAAAHTNSTNGAGSMPTTSGLQELETESKLSDISEADDCNNQSVMVTDLDGSSEDDSSSAHSSSHSRGSAPSPLPPALVGRLGASGPSGGLHGATTHQPRGPRQITYTEIDFQKLSQSAIHKGDYTALEGILDSFMELIHETAVATQASIHNAVGDLLSLSWNATQKVVQPEVKAIRFLQRIAGSCPSSSLLSSCTMTGTAWCHYSQSSLKQRTLAIHLSFRAVFNALLALCRQYDAWLVDEATATAASFAGFMIPVDQLYKQQPQSRGNQSMRHVAQQQHRPSNSFASSTASSNGNDTVFPLPVTKSVFAPAGLGGGGSEGRRDTAGGGLTGPRSGSFHSGSATSNNSTEVLAFPDIVTTSSGGSPTPTPLSQHLNLSPSQQQPQQQQQHSRPLMSSFALPAAAPFASEIFVEARYASLIDSEVGAFGAVSTVSPPAAAVTAPSGEGSLSTGSGTGASSVSLILSGSGLPAHSMRDPNQKETAEEREHSFSSSSSAAAATNVRSSTTGLASSHHHPPPAAVVVYELIVTPVTRRHSGGSSSAGTGSPLKEPSSVVSAQSHFTGAMSDDIEWMYALEALEKSKKDFLMAFEFILADKYEEAYKTLTDALTKPSSSATTNVTTSPAPVGGTELSFPSPLVRRLHHFLLRLRKEAHGHGGNGPSKLIGGRPLSSTATCSGSSTNAGGGGGARPLSSSTL